MKKMNFMMAVLFATSAFAQTNQNTNNNQNNNQNNSYSGVSASTARCDKLMDTEFEQFFNVNDKNYDPKKKPADRKVLEKCEMLYFASVVNRAADIGTSFPTIGSSDQKIVCNGRAGFALDYQSCKNVVGLYNKVLFADTAMKAQQLIRVNSANQKASKTLAEEAAKGNTHNAAIDAAEERNRQNSKLYTEQAIAYSGAVTALGVGISGWRGNKESAYNKICKHGLKDASKAIEEKLRITKVDHSMCMKSIAEAAKHQSDAFPNTQAKANAFKIASEFFIKAAEARRLAGLSEDVAKKLSQIPSDVTDEDVLFDQCTMYPEMAECKNGTPRSTGTGFGGSTISFGDGGGSNAFDFDGATSGTTIEDGAVGTDKEQVVATTSSPFEEEAKRASGILDPAAAASATPGSGGSAALGGGGGGGAGGGGGGGGSGVEKEEDEGSGEPEIKANKYTANYAGGSKGFGAVQEGKEDANPFASLFDNKGQEGGIEEEDRSIASEGGSLGLFDKITGAYKKAYESKQIEANNLE